MDYPGLGEIPIPGIPIKLSSSPGSINTAAPKLGEHNNDVYFDLLGFDKAQLSILKRDGVV